MMNTQMYQNEETSGQPITSLYNKSGYNSCHSLYDIVVVACHSFANQINFIGDIHRLKLCYASMMPRETKKGRHLKSTTEKYIPFPHLHTELYCIC